MINYHSFKDCSEIWRRAVLGESLLNFKRKPVPRGCEAVYCLPTFKAGIKTCGNPADLRGKMYTRIYNGELPAVNEMRRKISRTIRPLAQVIPIMIVAPANVIVITRSVTGSRIIAV